MHRSGRVLVPLCGLAVPHYTAAMQSSSPQSLELECHPASPRLAVHRLQVQLSDGSGGQLRLRYLLDACMARLRIPAPAAPERADELWCHTCFEAFISTADVSSYYEFNFSPSSRWAVYRFESYRHGMSPAVIESPPQISVERFEHRLELDVSMSFAGLTGLPRNLPLRVALAAVIQSEEGDLSYWALRHPGSKPDFHHAGGFSAVMEVK